MQRRQFMALAGGGLVFAGCKPRNPAEVGLGSDAKRSLAEQKAARERHLAMLERFRVPPEASRTTPPRVVDLLKEFPDLRSRVRVAVRLHPRYSEEPKRHESKLGGAILWPAEEPWPADDMTKLAYQPILQLRLEDAPAQLKFPKGKDLCQILWLPREDAATKVKVVWRKGSESEGAQAELPSMEFAFMNMVPVPCRLFPERVPELPEVASLPQGELKSKIEAWPSPDAAMSGPDYMKKYLNASPGTKAGGYVRREGQADPTCDTCRWPMDYLLTIGSDDYGNDPKWAPQEEKDNPAKGYSNASGLALAGSGHRHVFLCRRCLGMPAKAMG